MLTCFDSRACNLGEGALWHPLRAELFWFDITGRRMLSLGEQGAREWHLDEMCSSAGWVDSGRLVIASETALWLMSLNDGKRERLCELEADNPRTRSNDGRIDPYGGFWISTMGKKAQRGEGSIWRWFRGELRRIFSGITIPNAICFDRLGRFAQFTDTPTMQIMRVALDSRGWPASQPERWLDLSGDRLNPDGAVIDAEGLVWIAQWGSGRIAAYGPDRAYVRAVNIPAPNASCPAFGGANLDVLFCTSALQGLDVHAVLSNPQSGMTFSGRVGAFGCAESRLLLD